MLRMSYLDRRLSKTRIKKLPNKLTKLNRRRSLLFQAMVLVNFGFYAGYYFNIFLHFKSENAAVLKLTT